MLFSSEVFLLTLNSGPKSFLVPVNGFHNLTGIFLSHEFFLETHFALVQSLHSAVALKSPINPLTNL